MLRTVGQIISLCLHIDLPIYCLKKEHSARNLKERHLKMLSLNNLNKHCFIIYIDENAVYSIISNFNVTSLNLGVKFTKQIIILSLKYRRVVSVPV